MKKWLLLFNLFSSTLLLAQGSAPQDLSSVGNPFDSELNNQHEPPMLGIRWARGFDPTSRSSEAQRITATTRTSVNIADTQTGHSQGLAALGNVSGHELSEARGDPAYPGAWYDSKGQENGDKCAWTFDVPYVTFTDGSIWKIQGEWSNAEYTAGTGYPNTYGQRGCLDGH